MQRPLQEMKVNYEKWISRFLRCRNVWRIMDICDLNCPTLELKYANIFNYAVHRLDQPFVVSVRPFTSTIVIAVQYSCNECGEEFAVFRDLAKHKRAATCKGDDYEVLNPDFKTI